MAGLDSLLHCLSTDAQAPAYNDSETCLLSIELFRVGMLICCGLEPDRTRLGLF